MHNGKSERSLFILFYANVIDSVSNLSSHIFMQNETIVFRGRSYALCGADISFGRSKLID